MRRERKHHPQALSRETLERLNIGKRKVMNRVWKSGAGQQAVLDWYKQASRRAGGTGDPFGDYLLFLRPSADDLAGAGG